ncbi:MAG: hypothetical protein SGI92_18510, partial [Bryobacteraceae bacterium]|nr:hypothetical protein [Bryobacteraceae bacterium]
MKKQEEVVEPHDTGERQADAFYQHASDRAVLFCIPLTPILDSDTWDQIARQYMIRLSDEDLNDPVVLGRCAALTGLSP